VRKAAWAVGIVIGAFLVVRAVVELLTLDFLDAASYRDDWGGPSLFGVLLVHAGPGVIAAALFVLAYLRHRSASGRGKDDGTTAG
jgi:hypothetical protein